MLSVTDFDCFTEIEVHGNSFLKVKLELIWEWFWSVVVYLGSGTKAYSTQRTYAITYKKNVFLIAGLHELLMSRPSMYLL